MRAGRRSQALAEEALGPPDAQGYTEFLVTELAYNDGKFSGGPRGYFMTCLSEGRQEREGLVSTSYGIASGGAKVFVEAAQRFSEKTLAALAERITAAQLGAIKSQALASIAERKAAYKAAAEKQRAAQESAAFEAARRSGQGADDAEFGPAP